jgi:hypothetical protein
MPSLFDPQAPETFRSRIDRLSSDSQPLWGRMNVEQMVVHCDLQLKLALGELTAAPMKTPVGRFPLKQLALYVLPTPKSVPTMPELRDPPTGDWRQDLDTLKADIGRVAAQDPGRPWPRHSAFGDLSGRQWGRLIWKHLDHHLRQFGA